MREKDLIGEKIMSTVSQRAWNRLTKHAFKRYRKSAVEVVQWAGANSRAHRQWCGYSIVPMRERLQRELDATSQPTAIRVFQIKPVPCMCRLCASQGPGGDGPVRERGWSTMLFASTFP